MAYNLIRARILPITVVETNAFVSRAERCMSEAERCAAIDMIGRDPERGAVLEGGSGIRKVRFAVRGRGKSSGVRIIYYYQNDECPVFLLTVFAKNERDNLSRAEVNALAKVAKAIAETYGEGQ
jgi:hypothetical protein